MVLGVYLLKNGFLAIAAALSRSIRVLPEGLKKNRELGSFWRVGRIDRSPTRGYVAIDLVQSDLRDIRKTPRTEIT
jgi:hypothetical protein